MSLRARAFVITALIATASLSSHAQKRAGIMGDLAADVAFSDRVA